MIFDTRSSGYSLINNAISHGIIKSDKDIIEVNAIKYERYATHMIEYLSQRYDNINHMMIEPLFGYLFVKAVENVVSTQLYQSIRKNDIYYNPSNMFYEEILTNLPFHLHVRVNHTRDIGKILANFFSSVASPSAMGDESFMDELCRSLVITQLIGDAYAINENICMLRIKEYRNTDLLTTNELREIPMRIVYTFLENNRYSIEACTANKESIYNFKVQKGRNTYYVYMDVAVTPLQPEINILDKEELCTISVNENAIPSYISVSIGSKNQQHFNDGVAIRGDQYMVCINNFYELSK